MIVYFGRDERGCYCDREDGTRQYVDEATWMAFIRASARPSPVKNGARLKLLITEQAVLEKYEGGTLLERVELTPETTTIGD